MAATNEAEARAAATATTLVTAHAAKTQAKARLARSAHHRSTSGRFVGNNCAAGLVKGM